jgi:hypothetical protein
MVGWLTSIPTEMSQTHASAPMWLATELSSRNFTGSARAFQLHGHHGCCLDGQRFADQRRERASGRVGQRQGRLSHVSILTASNPGANDQPVNAVWRPRGRASARSRPRQIAVPNHDPLPWSQPHPSCGSSFGMAVRGVR